MPSSPSLSSTLSTFLLFLPKLLTLLFFSLAFHTLFLLNTNFSVFQTSQLVSITVTSLFEYPLSSLSPLSSNSSFFEFNEATVVRSLTSFPLVIRPSNASPLSASRVGTEDSGRFEIELAFGFGESEEDVGFCLRKWSRSRLSPDGKPLLDRRRSSQFGPDYYSSWCIQAAKSRHDNGQLSACEVQLFHQEDMGIPWEITKLAVRKGMWDAVMSIESGLRAYQKQRAVGGIISRPAFMAQINTKINLENLKASAGTEVSSQTAVVTASDEKLFSGNIRNLIIVGGSILLACTLDRGYLVKTIVFGVANKFGNVGKKSKPK